MIRTAPNPGTGQVEVTFTVERTAPSEAALSVVGDFNSWEPGADPFTLSPDAREWQATVSLHPGRRYAFRYLASGGQWFTDESAQQYEDNGTGERNAILDLSPAASLAPPQAPAAPSAGPPLQPGGFNGGAQSPLPAQSLPAQSQSSGTGADELDRLSRTGPAGTADARPRSARSRGAEGTQA